MSATLSRTYYGNQIKPNHFAQLPQVSVDLELTAFANSSVHFEQRKKHIAKQVHVCVYCPVLFCSASPMKEVCQALFMPEVSELMPCEISVLTADKDSDRTQSVPQDRREKGTSTAVNSDKSYNTHVSASLSLWPQTKTVAAHEVSLKIAEKKALAQLQKVRAVPLQQVQRKPHWFERFNWFISRCVGIWLMCLVSSEVCIRLSQCSAAL